MMLTLTVVKLVGAQLQNYCKMDDAVGGFDLRSLHDYGACAARARALPVHRSLGAHLLARASCALEGLHTHHPTRAGPLAPKRAAPSPQARSLVLMSTAAS